MSLKEKMTSLKEIIHEVMDENNQTTVKSTPNDMYAFIGTFPCATKEKNTYYSLYRSLRTGENVLSNIYTSEKDNTFPKEYTYILYPVNQKVMELGEYYMYVSWYQRYINRQPKLLEQPEQLFDLLKAAQQQFTKSETESYRKAMKKLNKK